MLSARTFACVGVLALLTACGDSPQAPVTPPPAAAQAPPPPSSPPPPDSLKPDAPASAGLPPIPFMDAARPPDVVRAIYTFAAEHPEVLSKVPCFCGCERMGHRGNDDCFVKSRDASGRVTGWEPHGAT